LGLEFFSEDFLLRVEQLLQGLECLLQLSVLLGQFGVVLLALLEVLGNLVLLRDFLLEDLLDLVVFFQDFAYFAFDICLFLVYSLHFFLQTLNCRLEFGTLQADQAQLLLLLPQLLLYFSQLLNFCVFRILV
jgi:hypothetical protein